MNIRDPFKPTLLYRCFTSEEIKESINMCKCLSLNSIFAVKPTYCVQKHNALSTYLASRASANIPAASGAAAEVPECVVVQLLYKSVVA